jgi:predicted TPR repeat methyltransferase
MSSPEVGQRHVLDRILREALHDVRPRALLILGCSTGHGLEYVDGSVTSCVTGVDVNRTYLDRLVERFPDPPFALDVRCADLMDARFEPNDFDLVHAALVFEYIEWPRLLPRLAPSLRAGGVLNVVLQRPSPSTPAVTPTRFGSLSSLEALFRFVEPEALVERARGVGLSIEQRHTMALPGSKAFEVLRFTRGASGV